MKKYSRKYIMEALKYWRNQLQLLESREPRCDLDEEEIVMYLSPYHGKRVFAVSGRKDPITAQHILSLIVRRFSTLSDRQLTWMEMNIANHGKILGIANELAVEDNKLIIYVAPYVNGSRRQNYSLHPEIQPLKLKSIVEQLQAIPDREIPVVIRLRKGMGPDWQEPVDFIPFSAEIDEKHGMFVRIEHY